MPNTDATHKVKDIGLAAFLIVKGYRVVRTEMENRTVFFVFEDTGLIEETERAYNYERAEIPAKEFHDTLRTLKFDIANALRGGQKV